MPPSSMRKTVGIPDLSLPNIPSSSGARHEFEGAKARSTVKAATGGRAVGCESLIKKKREICGGILII
jgi:hypothetical protein